MEGLFPGFAMAAQPIQGQAISTDSKGLISSEVGIPVRDGTEMPAYLASPSEGGSFPLVLVIHEIFGVHEHIRDVCRRLARIGCMAIAPELFFRLKNAAAMTEIGEIMKEVVSQTPDGQIMRDLDSVLAWAGDGAFGSAITGFCWGGRIAWLYCAHNPGLKAGVAWYGRLEGQKSELQPEHPLDVVPQLRVPVLGLYGGADQSIPQSSVEKMRSALETAGNDSEIIVYPDAPHAFFADYRPSYRKEAAEDGWQRLQGWFLAHGILS